MPGRTNQPNNWLQTSQQELSQPSAKPPPSRHAIQGLFATEAPPRWKQTSTSHTDETDTPRASGIVDSTALSTYSHDPSTVSGVSRTDQFVRSLRSLNGDAEIEPYDMPPITLGVLSHHRHASSIDSNDSPPTHSPATFPAASASAPPPAAFMAINERVIMTELAKSKDHGDTLDLSRKGIERIGEDDVQILRYGVGKGGKGVWR